MRTILSFLTLATLLFVTVGCGPTKSKAQGKLVQNGQPLTVSDKGVITLRFFAEDDKENAKPYPANTKPDGTFTVTGLDGQGIPPGKYRVSVEAQDPYPGHDKLKAKYTPSMTQLTAELGKGGEVVIDVGK